MRGEQVLGRPEEVLPAFTEVRLKEKLKQKELDRK
jgi:hypothetical protein